MNKQIIYAAIVTYNREEYLKKLINALFEQSIKLTGIIILDNFSNENTVKMLKEVGYINKNLNIDVDNLYINKIEGTECYYYKNSYNSGGSGGFNKVFELATNIEMDYLWVMDDDVMPEKDCLEQLLKHINKEVKICIPSRTDGNYVDILSTGFNFDNPLKYAWNRKKTTLATEYSNNVEVVDMPFEGPLISMDIIKNVGLPNSDYFIFYDDTDYAYRALKFTKILYVKSAILHKLIIPKQEKKKKLTWREYYYYRNAVYFERKYGENIFVKNISPFLMWLHLTMSAVLKLNYKNIPVINKAYIDGMRGKLGKTVEPGSF